MAYKLYTDKKENFECDLFLEGADLKDTNARIILETQNLTLLFQGTIDKEGNCKVPIRKLRGLLDEKTTGNIKLEVIAEGTLIEPWQSDFVVSTSKKVKVEVKSQKSINEVKDTINKPQVKVSNIKNHFDAVKQMVTILTENKVTLSKVVKNKKRIAPILESYSNKVEYQGGTKKFIREVIQKLSKT